MSLKVQLFFAGLTCLLAYQAWYNLVGALELGGKYMNTDMLIYSVGSLLLAIALGIHATKLARADSLDERKKLAEHKTAKRFAYLYCAILAGMVIVRVYSHFQYNYQLSPEHIVSFEKSMKWQVYYWGVIQYGLAIVLSIAYLHKARTTLHQSRKCEESLAVTAT